MSEAYEGLLASYSILDGRLELPYETLPYYGNAFRSLVSIDASLPRVGPVMGEA